MKRREVLAGLGVAGLASVALGSVAATWRAGGEEGVDHPDAAVRRRKRFVNVPLRTQEDREVRFYDDLIKDKTVLINFMYTACKDDCSLTTAKLVQVQRALGDRVGRDIFMYSITIDPEHDTPAALRQYARRFGVKPGWLFLTGTAGDIKRLRRSFGDDPGLGRGRSNHLDVIRFGIEPLQRWAGCPAWTRPGTIIRYLSWIEPRGERPDGRLPGPLEGSDNT